METPASWGLQFWNRVLFASTTENSAFWNRSVLQRSIIRLPTLPVAGIDQREWPQLCEETTDLRTGDETL